MKKLTKILVLSACAACALTTVSLAGSVSYRSNILLLNAHKTFASSTKSSGTNNKATNSLYASSGRAMTMWIDGNTGSWNQVTGSLNFNPGNAKTYTYNSTPKSGSQMRLRGRSVTQSAGGQDAAGYVNFN